MRRERTRRSGRRLSGGACGRPGAVAAPQSKKLSDLTAEQLERVSRFGVLPSYPNRMKKAVGASDLLSEGGPA